MMGHRSKRFKLFAETNLEALAPASPARRQTGSATTDGCPSLPALGGDAPPWPGRLAEAPPARTSRPQLSLKAPER